MDRWRKLITTVVPAITVMLVATACFGDQGNVFSLEVGQCFDDPDVEASEISDVVIVDCASPHGNEVYAVFDLPGTDYPGSDEVFAAGQAGCAEQFVAYVGVALGETELVATFLAPTEQSWDNSDDREVICYLLDGGGARLRGSMRASG